MGANLLVETDRLMRSAFFRFWEIIRSISFGSEYIGGSILSVRVLLSFLLLSVMLVSTDEVKGEGGVELEFPKEVVDDEVGKRVIQVAFKAPTLFPVISAGRSRLCNT